MVAVVVAVVPLPLLLLVAATTMKKTQPLAGQIVGLFRLTLVCSLVGWLAELARWLAVELAVWLAGWPTGCTGAHISFRVERQPR